MKMRIEYASQTSPWIESPEMERLLQAFGHPEAMVSSESTVGDFISGEKDSTFEMIKIPWRKELQKVFNTKEG